jgi:preprotein translocase subunit SecE
MLLYECKKEQNHKIKRKEKKMKVLAVIGVIILSLGIALAVNAGLIWLLTWGLVKLGITTICGWTVAFSWPLVIVFTIIYAILKGIFTTIKKES